ncbi:MAG: hypothetical protein ACRCZW_03450, partial [Lactobacillaceae bacterium]
HDIYNYLLKLVNELIISSNKSRTNNSSTKENLSNAQYTTKKKWCSLHKNTTHMIQENVMF